MEILDSDNNVIKDDKISLGIVSIGDSKEYTFYINNDSIHELIDIDVKLEHDEIEVSDVPSRLDPKQKAKVRIKWTPEVTVEEKGLEVKVKIYSKELWR